MTAGNESDDARGAALARDQELAFRITARRNRLIGTWAAELMALTPAETDAYAKAVVQADFEESGDEDVIRKLFGDLVSADVEVDEKTIRAMLDEKTIEARRQLIGSL